MDGKNVQELILPAPGMSGATDDSDSQPTFQHMLDVVDYGMLLIGPTGQVVFANRSARISLADHPVLRLENSTLRLFARDAALLRDALVSAVHKGCQRLLTLGTHETTMLCMAIIPLQEAGNTSPNGAMLFLGKRKECDELCIDAYARQRGLTMAEQRVLKLLCAGQRPAETAGFLGVALSTVRTQIASILEKTDTVSMGALLRELSRLPPLRSLLRPAGSSS